MFSLPWWRETSTQTPMIQTTIKPPRLDTDLQRKLNRATFFQSGMVTGIHSLLQDSAFSGRSLGGKSDKGFDNKTKAISTYLVVGIPDHGKESNLPFGCLFF